jgi:hypothetical protein
MSSAMPRELIPQALPIPGTMLERSHIVHSQPLSYWPYDKLSGVENGSIEEHALDTNAGKQMY